MPGLEASTYPPGQYVVPPRGNRSTPAYSQPVLKGVPANTPQSPPSSQNAYLAILSIQFAAASATELQIQVGPSVLGGFDTVGFPLQAAAAATVTSEQMTLLIPAGGQWQWQQITGAAAGVAVSYVPVLGPQNP